MRTPGSLIIVGSEFPPSVVAAIKAQLDAERGAGGIITGDVIKDFLRGTKTKADVAVKKAKAAADEAARAQRELDAARTAVAIWAEGSFESIFGPALKDWAPPGASPSGK